MTAHKHDTEASRKYKNVEKTGVRPVVYNAMGTHATYFEKGWFWGLTDRTCKREKWDFWKNMDVIFPWDWTSDQYVIHSDNELDGMNYLTQVHRWGNKGRGRMFFDAV